jgi:diguanylate cyclase (GGDEF)-like protein
MKRQRLAIFRKKASKPIEVVFWIGILGVTILGWFLPMSRAEEYTFFLLALGACLFVIFLYHGIMPRYGTKDWVNYVLIVGATFFIAGASYLLKPYNVHIEILYIGVIAGVGMLAGKEVANRAALLSAIALATVTILGEELTPVMLITLGLQVLVILLVGYLVSTLADVLHNQISFSDRQNRDLKLLLKTGNFASHSDELRRTLSNIAELVVKDVPATSCRIALLNSTGDSLETYGAYPLNSLKGWKAGIGAAHALSSLPLHLAALQSGKNLVLTEITPAHTQEVETYFFHAVRTVCLVPLIAKGKKLGLLSIGEMRGWGREPFNQEKLNLLQTLASQVSGLIYNTQLYQASQRQAEHLQVLNQVARAIGSTLELDQLLESLYGELQAVIPSDSYYVSLYDPIEDLLDVRVLIDLGERFEPVKLPARKGLASSVIENKRPVHIRHMSNELDRLAEQPLQIGQERMSESWLGVPILLGDELLGLLVLASYRPNAFDDEDAAVLSNVAAQAALAIDNARHHAEVEEQARRDSLTGAYNHGYLLRYLEDEVELARPNHTPVSLIMMDIDYFKQYNDTYGHVVGDEVLCLLVQAILSHVKKSDIVGRWGGEEFAVALPGTSNRQALIVAERIRSTLAVMELYDRDGNPIPKPTVSQGIATFPHDVGDATELVDVADQALYIAKQRGRDQIMVAVKSHS